MFSFRTLEQLLFISHFVFRRERADFFFQMKAGQNNMYDITKTSGLVQV